MEQITNFIIRPIVEFGSLFHQLKRLSPLQISTEVVLGVPTTQNYKMGINGKRKIKKLKEWKSFHSNFNFSPVQ